MPDKSPRPGDLESAPEDLIIQVVAEELEVETRQVTRGAVRIHKRVETHEEIVDVPVIHEDVVIEHVAVNAVVEGDPPETREEDGVLVIPVLEEAVVVQKQLMLRAYAAVLADGYARADVDILTNDDRDDEPKLARMHSWVPEPDLDIYLAGVRDGG